jgi:spore germination cell wall hydrolase CwlJ-like protein
MGCGFNSGSGALLFAALVAIMVPAARAYTPDPWERQVVAACLVLEASSEGPLGLMAVANVISNRAHGNPRQFYKVVRKPYAFSSFNAVTEGRTGGRGYAPMVRKASRDPNWGLSLKVVDRLYSGTLQDLTNGATHFTLKRQRASWMSEMKVTAIIGSHKFMRKN